jgi:hypothetical protein
VPIRPILHGTKTNLAWAAGASGRFRGKEYFDKLDERDQARFDALFRRMATTGEIRNEELFRHEFDDIYCFKRGQHRLACYREGKTLMLIHGFRKKSDKGVRHKREIETAVRISNEHRRLTQGNHDA